MSTTYNVTLGDRGRIVVPAALRAHQRWDQGTPLLLVDAPGGVVITTREQARALIRAQLGDADLVGELLAERRATADREDAA
ncbi:AbrB/MazE/SpoVT family DNA-binding domain-containing protein [Microbacterium sp.]|uniref:AbrB/MazE/SpoVT family DNA-binding domain-containing protein n=1 Tax=Microbacterium sp. TaxID=51671 RepID=UPI0039E5288E